jgi:hypothetical protein
LRSKQFYLNGCFFQPYEQETSGERKQFRLLSEPPLKPEKEAAIIRYLINEGDPERRVAQMARVNIDKKGGGSRQQCGKEKAWSTA